MKDFRKNTKGRGSSGNTLNRFDRQHLVLEPYDGEEFSEDEMPLLRTEFLRDTSRSIVSENKSPDIPFRYSVNPYRGCEHGCAYCYARPTHEYLGHSAGLDFESKIYVKEDAAKLLYEKLMSPSWKGEQITFSGNTDCYQPIIEFALKKWSEDETSCPDFLPYDSKRRTRMGLGKARPPNRG